MMSILSDFGHHPILAIPRLPVDCLFGGTVFKPSKLFCAGVLSLSLALSAKEGHDQAMANRIRGDLEFLASDALQGRGSGTRDELLAAVYLASELRRIG